MSVRWTITLLLAFGLLGCTLEPGQPRTPRYLVRPSGLQCVTTPCAVWEALDTRSCRYSPFDEIDLAGVAGSEAERQRLLQQLSGGRLVVEGQLSRSGGLPPPGTAMPTQAPLVFYVSDVIGDPPTPPCLG
jgi:hypothetical protein